MTNDLSAFATAHWQDMTSPMDLDNGIHPAFCIDDWEIDTTPKLKAKFKNNSAFACRLATKLLTTQSLEDFWLHIMAASKKYDQMTGISVLEKCPIAEYNAMVNPSRAQLETYTHDLKFSVRDLGGGRWGLTSTASPSLVKGLIPNTVVVGTPMTLAWSPAFSKEAYQLQLALIMVHEFAHAIGHSFHPYTLLGETDTEPLHSASDPVPEMGHSWETWLLGGKIPKMSKIGILGGPSCWRVKELSPIRTAEGAKQIHAHLSGKARADYPYPWEVPGGLQNMKTMLRLLSKGTWAEIEVKGRQWFQDEKALLRSKFEEYQ
ncbi:hypothetical protein EJ08DRAFT_695008 [Tothia fuscella]|uniref:Uncharacterized protein n=1 Tax=Tothia fuscella TaxID=1048955 RepID=A0A9P4NX28_9PEZI|nr:hypothetical protein EJ08DRAFT_695008 [Tothia fuscella]